MAAGPAEPHSQVSNVPILDLSGEIRELRSELDAAIARVLDRGSFVLGKEVSEFEAEVAAHLKVKHAVGLNSGTDALTIGLRALGVGPGDEVITSPFTFFATAESIALVGATPVFVDIEAHTFNLDPGLVEAAITPRSKVILPIHLYGRPAPLLELRQLAESHGLTILEDAAQSFGAAALDVPGNPYSGTVGEMGAFSFYPTKNLGAYGDAGMIVTNDDGLALEARKLRTHGSLKAYENSMVGYNSRLDEIQAAILRVKLPHVKHWNETRRELADAYRRELGELEGIVLPEPHPGHIYHQFTIRVQRNRDRFLEHLRGRGILANVYYPTLASELAGGLGRSLDTPVAKTAAAQVLSLPILHGGSANEDFGRVVEAVREAATKI